ncbi:MAG: beta-aspartyl-peptidase [Clostridia bacterium]|nr:beta-aspartyl-peptidase [Clostridia bacterium]
MLTLWKNCDVYAPKHLGIRDLLIEGDRIAAIGESLDYWRCAPNIAVRDMEGAFVCPGLVDIHTHVAGGGGEQGPASRTPELQLTDFTLNGVTSVVGLLGTDGISRSLENLLYKVRALEEEGLSAWMMTGSYRFPSVTLFGDVERDIALIDKVIGVKTALSDHRSSAITGPELARLASEARVGGMLSGKPGIVNIHMGGSEHRMEQILWVLNHTDIPPQNLLPTHCCRTPELVAEAAKLTQKGSYIDFTADIPDSEAGTSAALCSAIRQGAAINRITMSSDAGGSQPAFNQNGECVGLTYFTSATLLYELRRMIRREGLSPETALMFFTENPARLIGQAGKKGVVAIGADADLLVLDGDCRVLHVLLKGREAVRNGAAVMTGRFQR